MKTIPAFTPLVYMTLFDNIEWEKPKLVSNRPFVY